MISLLDTQIKGEVKYYGMAKSLMRLEALRLRKKGISCKKIAELLDISKSTISHWTSDVILSVEQLENLRQSSIKGAELGRLRSALLQKHRRLTYIEEAKKRGVQILSKLSEREFLIAGLAVYWGEGCKKKHGIELCNSDPGMIKFFIIWLKRCFNVRDVDVRCRIGINEMHIDRD